jgi:hypothetical protein
MGRLIKLHEIEEFSAVVNVPESAATDAIIARVRELDEKTQLEVFLREILADPNETPHGPTEIADILTPRVTVRGAKTVAAFVLKGARRAMRSGIAICRTSRVSVRVG